MKPFAKSLLLAPALLILVALQSSTVLAADASASPSAKKATRFPFHGKLTAVDTTAMTFTLSGTSARVFIVTADTKIRKNGDTAKLTDAVVGDDVGGYASKAADGTLTALSVRFGLRMGAKKTSPGPSAAPSAQ